MRITASARHTDWTYLKQHRNMLLLMTDRFYIPDFVITAEELNQVTAYKNELRTMFDGLVSKSEVAWPVPPAIVVKHLGPVDFIG